MYSKKRYITPTTHIVLEEQDVFLAGSSHQGGVIATGPDMEGEMNCPCDGDENKCDCYHKNGFCDCWGCGGWD